MLTIIVGNSRLFQGLVYILFGSKKIVDTCKEYLIDHSKQSASRPISSIISLRFTFFTVFNFLLFESCESNTTKSKVTIMVGTIFGLFYGLLMSFTTWKLVESMGSVKFLKYDDLNCWRFSSPNFLMSPALVMTLPVPIT